MKIPPEVGEKQSVGLSPRPRPIADVAVECGLSESDLLWRVAKDRLRLACLSDRLKTERVSRIVDGAAHVGLFPSGTFVVLTGHDDPLRLLQPGGRIGAWTVEDLERREDGERQVYEVNYNVAAAAHMRQFSLNVLPGVQLAVSDLWLVPEDYSHLIPDMQRPADPVSPEIRRRIKLARAILKERPDLLFNGGVKKGKPKWLPLAKAVHERHPKKMPSPETLRDCLRDFWDLVPEE